MRFDFQVFRQRRFAQVEIDQKDRLLQILSNADGQIDSRGRFTVAIAGTADSEGFEFVIGPAKSVFAENGTGRPPCYACGER